jgi:hypothetical protein
LLECNDSEDSLILRIIRTIPLSVLINNLRRIYSLFLKFQKEEYRDELFKRCEKPFEEMLRENKDAVKDDDYYEFIIENGFFIYVLL